MLAPNPASASVSIANRFVNKPLIPRYSIPNTVMNTVLETKLNRVIITWFIKPAPILIKEFLTLIFIPIKIQLTHNQYMGLVYIFIFVTP
jgi:hypothetical protein